MNKEIRLPRGRRTAFPQKSRSKKLLAWALALTMTAGLCPAALAAETPAVTAPFQQGEISVQSAPDQLPAVENSREDQTPADWLTANPLYVGGAQLTGEKLSVTGTTGSATFSMENGVPTLTLNGYTNSDSYTWDAYGNPYAALYYGGSAPLTINMVGTNALNGPDETSGSNFGIRTVGPLTFTGTGTLEATGGTSTEQGSRGISANTITVNSGELTATGRTGGNFGYGISANTITVNGGTLNASGPDIGIQCNGNLSVNGGKLTATATDTESVRGFGIQFDGGPTLYDELTVSGGSLTATGEIGVQSGVPLSIIVKNGGSLTAIATGESSIGINIWAGGIILSGGSLTATGNYYSTYESGGGARDTYHHQRGPHVPGLQRRRPGR